MCLVAVWSPPPPLSLLQVAVTGYVDLRGKMYPVGQVREKILHCKSRGVGLVIVPAEDLDELNEEGWASAEDLQYVQQAVRGARSFVDMLELAVTGAFVMDGAALPWP